MKVFNWKTIRNWDKIFQFHPDLNSVHSNLVQPNNKSFKLKTVRITSNDLDFRK